MLLSGCSTTIHNSKQASMSEAYVKDKQRQSNKASLIIHPALSKDEYNKLSKIDFKNGDNSFVYVNHNKSYLNPKDWKENKVYYQNLDLLNRTSGSNKGFLEKRNLASGALRVRQYIEPTAWHYNHRKQIYNRGHLIAYSLSAGIDKNGKYSPSNESGDQNNPKNLFTQSAYSNQKIQTIYETKVREALKKNKRIIFQATPIFRGRELMARGINLQAISTDKTLNFNVYLFNVEPGYIFNYSNGNSTANSNFYVDGINNYDSNTWNKSFSFKNQKYTNSYCPKYYLYKKYFNRKVKDHYNKFKNPKNYNHNFHRYR